MVCAARPAVFLAHSAPPVWRAFVPRVGALYSFPMRDFMLHTNSARLSVGALGVGGGSVSARPLLGGATIGGGSVRGEYTQERQ